MHVILVGGGIMGLLSAYELVQAGCAVSLFDKSQTGTEASWAGGGIVSPLYPWRYEASITALASWGQGFYPHLTEKLKADTGIDPEYNPCGLLMLDADDEAIALRWATQNQRAMHERSESEAKQIEPHIGCAVTRALWMPEVGSVRNPRLLQALLKRLLAHSGFTLHVNEAVIGLDATEGQVNGIVTDKGRYNADAVVLCAGAWSAALLESMQFALPVKPVRGQIVALQTPPGWLQRIVLKNGAYVVPRKDGLVLAGSTLEFVGYDKSTTSAAKDFLLGRAFGMMPELRDFPVVGHWAGLRPGTPDGVPFIGEMGSVRGLFLNTGHYRYGLVMAPASCRLLADLLLRREPIVDPKPYQPEHRLRAVIHANPEWR